MSSTQNSKKVIKLKKIYTKNQDQHTEKIISKKKLIDFSDKKNLAILLLIVCIPIAFFLGTYISYNTDFDAFLFGENHQYYGSLYYDVIFNQTESEIYLDIENIYSSHSIISSEYNINGKSEWFAFEIDEDFNNISILIDAPKYAFLNLGESNVNYIVVSIQNCLNLTIEKTLTFHI